ncbi:hypothetical protein [Aurantiacibacter spongiae]|uniref:DUF2157 domain-containing protein n=1 Tax=Aurantiacibacter spongiae TaxID=2488860 RepID=A0A3N5D8F2_9SPHN|nr:hypothetical protein [Aurantiacibacter spongiae]RPF70888.1 hypothetical protein EG799_04075 [Aurantiacibacter spongiae]
MYSEQDLHDAVAAGVITEEAATALRTHVARMRRMPTTDEENFRLVNSFNDIFVTIAAVLLVVAMAGIGNAVAPGVAGVLVAMAAWMMSEFFTRRRRMALPSIVLLLAFVGGVVAVPVEIMVSGADNLSEQAMTAVISGSFVAGAVAAWLHWRRFMVPITLAALCATTAGAVITLIVAAFDLTESEPETVVLPLVFIAGLIVFAIAMRWDTSDRARATRRSDVAFWLHLLAAPMIAHPLFHGLGITDGATVGLGGILAVLAVYVGFGFVALAVDRRALLVSALAYVLFALASLFDTYGMVELSVALTALVIGSALLTLSAFWAGIRASVVRKLPVALRDRLPLAGFGEPVAA